MRIGIFGTGYVGLVQAAVLAETGYSVLCVDVDASKVARLEAGEIPIYEPGLEGLVKHNRAEGRLKFTTQAADAVKHAGIQYIAVGTPPDEDGSADLKYVLAVAESIAIHMESHQIVINKSTVPVGTGDKVRAKIAETLKERGREDLTFDVVSNPEFLKEGSAVGDCMKPDRIVIGTNSRETEAVMRELYAPFNRNHEKIIVMDVRSAEMTKYAANCMLATRITFMNEMANLAEKLGADIEQVRHGIGSDPRIGYHFIYPGIGYGGSCFPKDVRALIQTAKAVGYETTLLNAVENRNNTQKTVLFNKLNAYFGGDLKGKVIALWGLAFKPNTDDMREAPSRVLMEALWEAGASVRAFDPEAMQEAERVYGKSDRLTLVENKEAALEGADALAIVTEWKAFHAPDFARIKNTLREPAIFDGRNIYDPAVVARHGIDYYAIGRGKTI
ncbi:MAG: UDP-glucose/GDP-mannose dehydrogenase family protein [Alphaproteobacteria bacterium]|nr:UDP-glucose/GDP-mannose dehydrogenase family protein [Alphaproteobacteria bacterium]